MNEREVVPTQLMPRLADLFSLEACFLLYLFAGTYKSYELLSSFNEAYDLTAFTAVLCLVSAVYLFMKEGVAIPRQNFSFMLLFIAYLLAATASYYVGGIYSENANLKIQKLWFFNTFSLMFPLALINTRVRIERLTRLFLTAAVAMGFESVLRTQIGGFSRFVGSFGTDGYQALGITTAMGVEIAVIALLFEKRLHVRYIYGFMAAVLMIAMMLSGARQALAGMIVCFAYVAYSLARAEIVARYLARWLAGGILFALAGLVVWFAVLPQVDTSWGANRMFAIFSDDGMEVLEASYRPMLWTAGIDVWREYPLFGAGFGSFSEVSSFPESRQPHNMFVEMVCELGVVGLIIACAMWWMPLHLMVKRKLVSKDPLLLILGGLWLHLAGCAQFSGDVTDNRHMFTFAGMLVALVAVSSRNANEKTSFDRQSILDSESCSMVYGMRATDSEPKNVAPPHFQPRGELWTGTHLLATAPRVKSR